MSKILPHTKLEVGTVNTAVLVCGDPARATRIADFLEGAVLLAEWREYRTYQGQFNGRTVTVCSHGIGAPGAAIAFEELAAAGAKMILRVGSCGGISPQVQAGELIVATAAVDNTGYGREILPPGYPAVADMDMVLSLRQAAQKQQRPWRAGIVLTRDAFYSGVMLPAVADYALMASANVLAVEMECAALFKFGSLRQVKTGAILAVDGNVLQTKESLDTFDPHKDVVRQTTDSAIQISLEALHDLNDETS
jgi:uridine phosphorylase